MPKIGPFKLGPILGQGASGTVRLGTHERTGITVALKIIKKRKLLENPELENQVRREIAILKVIDHPNVLHLYDLIETKSKLYLVLEHVTGGELFDYLLESGKLPAQEVLRICGEIVQGLEHCHDHGICHRDLKPENLLLSETNHIKVADFGLAYLMKPGQKLDTACGSPHYISPEIISGDRYDGRKADVWSLGVIVFALCAGYLPFDHDNTGELLELVQSGKYEMEPTIPAPIQDLIDRCLQVDVSQRISMGEIKTHPCFMGAAYFDPTIRSPIQELWESIKEGAMVIPPREELDVEILYDLQTLGLGTLDEESELRLFENGLVADLMAPLPKVTGSNLEPFMPKILYLLLDQRKNQRAIKNLQNELGSLGMGEKKSARKLQTPHSTLRAPLILPSPAPSPSPSLQGDQISSRQSKAGFATGKAIDVSVEREPSHGSLLKLSKTRKGSLDSVSSSPSSSSSTGSPGAPPESPVMAVPSGFQILSSEESVADRIADHQKRAKEREAKAEGKRVGGSAKPISFDSQRVRAGTGAGDLGRLRGANEGGRAPSSKYGDRGRLNTWGPSWSKSAHKGKDPALFFMEMALMLVLKTAKYQALLKAFLKKAIGDSSCVLGWMGPKLFPSLSNAKYFEPKLRTVWQQFKNKPETLQLPEVAEGLGQSIAGLTKFSSLKKRTLFDLNQLKFSPSQEAVRQLITMSIFSLFIPSAHGKEMMVDAKGTELSKVIKQCAGKKVMQAKLRTGKRKWLKNFSDAVENLPCCVTLLDMLGEGGEKPFLYANEEFEHITGYTRDDALDRRHTFLYGPETGQEGKDVVAGVLQEGKPARTCMTLHRRKGEAFTCFVSLRPVFLQQGGKRGSMRYVAMTLLDVSHSLRKGQLLEDLYYHDAIFNLIPRSV